MHGSVDVDVDVVVTVVVVVVKTKVFQEKTQQMEQKTYVSVFGFVKYTFTNSCDTFTSKQVILFSRKYFYFDIVWGMNDNWVVLKESEGGKFHENLFWSTNNPKEMIKIKPDWNGPFGAKKSQNCAPTIVRMGRHIIILTQWCNKDWEEKHWLLLEWQTQVERKYKCKG